MDNKEVFQSTRPRGARLFDLLYFFSLRLVSIHAPAGGATSQNPCLTWRRCVSIHAPAGGATIAMKDFGGGWTVSIHAPAGGATYGRLSRLARIFCFNPRARGGRDKAGGAYLHSVYGFNPRARGGRDLIANEEISFKLYVSIHAPAGGATVNDANICCNRQRFNPRARGGRD